MTAPGSWTLPERSAPAPGTWVERPSSERIRNVVAVAADLGWPARGTVPSRVVGESGNQEYFLLLGR